jgi:UDP-N-acetylglucosamine diphosphorylase/glucosamine-1-phosphate N-acetyltransferase
MKAVIMAAGASTRTVPLTLTRPKPLLKVANKSIIMHQLDALDGLVDEVVLIVSYMQDMVRDALGDGYHGLSLTYVDQGEPHGTGHAILQCARAVSGPFLAMNGDDLYAAEDLRTLAKSPNAALVKEVDDPRPYGIYETDATGRVKRLVEKPVNPTSNLANIGAYHFTPEIFEVLRNTPPSPRGEIEITSAIQTAADRGEFRIVRTKGYWIPIGYAWHLLDANEYILRNNMRAIVKGEVHPAAILTGPVYVGKGTIIRAGVVIDGPVMIGDDCELGPNCYIRPYTTIGNNCKVGHACELKNSILFDRAHVPHLSYIGDTVIGERTNLGAGTITSNFRHDGQNIKSMIKGELVNSGRRKFGAIIGDDVHTGINTSIYPGRKLWPHTSTRPGEVVQRDIEI